MALPPGEPHTVDPVSSEQSAELPRTAEDPDTAAHEREPSGRRPALIFTLVHGTFARDTDWVTDDANPKMFRSKLRAALEKDYDVRYEIVPWGHKRGLARLLDNTIARRLHGIDQLQQHLLACDDLDGDDQRFVVAHSHGGNIALCALNDENQGALLKKITGVISLSSPFLLYDVARFNRALLFFSALILGMVAVSVHHIALYIYTFVYLLIAATVVLARNFGETPASRIKIQDQQQRLTFVDKEQFVPGSGPLRFVAIRPHRDEVTILFWFTWGFGRLFRWLWELLNKIGTWLVAGFFVSGFALGAADWLITSLDSERLQDLRSGFDQFVLTPLFVILTAILSMMAVMRVSYAFDSLPWMPTIRVRPGTVPWEGAEKRVLRTFGLVKHTRVQNQSPETIAAWIREPTEPLGATGIEPVSSIV